MKQSKTIKLFVAMMLMISSLPVWGQSFSGSGSGTDSDPYLIYNPNHLNDVHNFIGQSGVVFKLMANIDLSSWLADNNPTNGWLPIGTEAQPFQGKFLGNDKTISGLFITRASTNDVGFFGYADGATISNLTISGSTVSGADHTGGLCGKANNSTISSCHVNIGVVGSTSNIGGFIGNIDNGCVIKNSSYTGDVNGPSSIAGFTGYARRSTLTNITINANVTSTNTHSGQCVGYLGAGNTTLTNVQAVGNLNGVSYVGGLVGRTKTGSKLKISNSSVNGNITGTSNLGGVIGASEADELTITNCKSTGNITGTSYLGGIIGLNKSQATVSTVYHDGKIQASEQYVGGLIGAGQSALCIEGCGHTGDVSGSSYVSGGIGCLSKSPTTSYSTDINYQSSNKSIIKSCFSVGDVSSDGICTGGLIGFSNLCSELVYLKLNLDDYDLWRYGYASDGTKRVYKYIINDNVCYSTTYYTNNDFPGCSFSRTIYSENGYVGAPLTGITINTTCLLGVSDSPELTNSYYSGNIEGTDYVGGILGYGDMISVCTSYASGSIFANQHVGGIAGRLLFNPEFSASGSISFSSIKSCVSANEIIVGTGGNTGRIYGSVGDNVIIGSTGTTNANKGLATAKVTSAGATVTLDDGPQHGTNVGASTLRLKSNYVGMGWDFDNYWKIQETECYPYKATQCAPPKITSQLISGNTSVSGQSIDGGTVVLITGNNSYSGTVTSNQWTISVPLGLQSGATVKACATKSGLMQSYYTTGVVAFAGGGTESDPYLIYTASDLANVNSYSFYKIMNDIDVSSWINSNSSTIGWIPIGMNSGVSMKQLDGNGKTISGLWTNSTTNNYGLISAVNDATIKDLTIIVASGKQVKGGDQTGVVVGLASGTTFENITINGKCTGNASVAGVTGNGQNCTFSNCSVTSTLTGTDNVGGVVGWSSGSTLSNCTSNVTINGTKYLGGLAGYSSNNSYTNCNSSGTIKSTTNNGYVGGIIGKAQTTTNTISKCSSSANVSGTSYIGGLVGNGVNSISESFSSGVVTGTKNDDCLAGGLTGLNEGTIRNCYSTATVTSGQYGAGITGINYGTIDRCYASGNVSAEKWGAGITAYNDGSAAKVTRCFAANNKIQVSDAGGIGMRMIGGFRNGASEPDGTNYALNSMVVSINNVTKIVYDDPLEGISVTQSQLYAQSTYVNNGWNFTDIWGIDEGNGYPYLLALVEEPTPDFTPGDVNDDGTINVSDYVATAGYILEQEPQPFNFAAADLDGNNDITVSDLVGVAYLALTYEGAPMLAPAIAMTDAPSIAMAADINRLDNNLYEVAINMSNNIALSAIQMDLKLPQGMTLVDATLSDRASASHQIAFNQLSDGDYRLLSSSPACKSFKGSDGAVLTLIFKGTPSSNGGLSNIIVAAPDANGYDVDDIELNFNLTGVDNVMSEARIYSEGGNIVIISPNEGTAQIVLPNGMNKIVMVSAGRNVYQAPTKGIVIVKMGNEAKKMKF